MKEQRDPGADASRLAWQIGERIECSTTNRNNPMLLLNIQSGPDAGLRRELTSRETLLIGRGEACGLQLSDGSVSRVHCRVTVSGGRVFVEDAGSRWGTLINGTPIETQELKPGDRIVIGDTELELELRSPAAETVAPARRRVLNDTAEPERAASLEEDPHSPESGPERPPAAPAAPYGIQKLTDLVGEKFLKYRVGSVVARAGSGMVFRALDSEEDRTVALKVYWPDFFQDENAVQRFLRAVKTMVGMEHTNLVKLHAAGRFQNLCFTASEFIEGQSVTQIIARVGIAGMLDWRRAFHIALGVTEALEFAHERNIIHRNIRPSNILIRESDDRVKLGDLMLAKAIDEMGTARITKPGEVVGDVCFLAPEQVSGETHVDGRADLYSLGATLYAVLTGRPPFEGTTADVIGKVITQPPEPPTKHHLAIPPAFEGLVLRMLAKRPEDRFASATALLKDLRRVGKYQNVSE
ncbi:MAG: FHA domain-containing protein [Planctomycetota bacterium]|nr:MAG: FHA domain-containing protein [Planctomycetota bacterium]